MSPWSTKFGKQSGLAQIVLLLGLGLMLLALPVTLKLTSQIQDNRNRATDHQAPTPTSSSTSGPCVSIQASCQAPKIFTSINPPHVCSCADPLPTPVPPTPTPTLALSQPGDSGVCTSLNCPAGTTKTGLAFGFCSCTLDSLLPTPPPTATPLPPTSTPRPTAYQDPNCADPDYYTQNLSLCSSFTSTLTPTPDPQAMQRLCELNDNVWTDGRCVEPTTVPTATAFPTPVLPPGCPDYSTYQAGECINSGDMTIVPTYPPDTPTPEPTQTVEPNCTFIQKLTGTCPYPTATPIPPTPTAIPTIPITPSPFPTPVLPPGCPDYSAYQAGECINSGDISILPTPTPSCNSLQNFFNICPKPTKAPVLPTPTKFVSPAQRLCELSGKVWTNMNCFEPTPIPTSILPPGCPDYSAYQAGECINSGDMTIVPTYPPATPTPDFDNCTLAQKLSGTCGKTPLVCKPGTEYFDYNSGTCKKLLPTPTTKPCDLYDHSLDSQGKCQLDPQKQAKNKKDERDKNIAACNLNTSYIDSYGECQFDLDKYQKLDLERQIVWQKYKQEESKINLSKCNDPAYARENPPECQQMESQKKASEDEYKRQVALLNPGTFAACGEHFEKKGTAECDAQETKSWEEFKKLPGYVAMGVVVIAAPEIVAAAAPVLETWGAVKAISVAANGYATVRDCSSATDINCTLSTASLAVSILSPDSGVVSSNGFRIASTALNTASGVNSGVKAIDECSTNGFTATCAANTLSSFGAFAGAAKEAAPLLKSASAAKDVKTVSGLLKDSWGNASGAVRCVSGVTDGDISKNDVANCAGTVASTVAQVGSGNKATASIAYTAGTTVRVASTAIDCAQNPLDKGCISGLGQASKNVNDLKSGISSYQKATQDSIKIAQSLPTQPSFGAPPSQTDIEIQDAVNELLNSGGGY